MFARLQSWLRRKAPTDAGAVETPKPEPPPERGDDASTDGFRETIEQIVIAFVLAFVFRTFAAEPFVIPTGSMAPTLFGRHKEFECAGCGYHNVIGASDEIPKNSSLLDPLLRIETAACQNCGYLNEVREELAFTGDRILVTKYPYEIGDPQRFDVFVFKCPEDPITNFIKRLIGLPGETIRISGGDVYRRTADGKFEILRKDPETQRLIQIAVYDDQFPPEDLLKAGFPERWAAMSPGHPGGLDGWDESTDGFEHDAEARSFELKMASEDWRWIRYRHYQSQPTDWDKFETQPRDPFDNQASLVADFCGYNAVESPRAPPIDWGIYWVGDLTVSFHVDIDSVGKGETADDSPALLLELVEGVNRYQCHIDLNTGKARLVSINDQNDSQEETPLSEESGSKTGMMGTGSHEVSFANVDNRLCLWVDGDLIDFGDRASYPSNPVTGNDLPTLADLTPVGIAVRGATLKVSQLLLERDIYYRADVTMAEHVPDGGPLDRAMGACMLKMSQNLTNPDAWGKAYHSVDDEQRRLVGVLDIEVGPEHYLALGDNSPRSGDSRYWAPDDRTVPRHLLVGKAFWIYWPHGVPFMNNGRGYSIWDHRQRGDDGVEIADDYPQYTIPFYPNFWRMRLIH